MDVRQVLMVNHMPNDFTGGNYSSWTITDMEVWYY